MIRADKPIGILLLLWPCLLALFAAQGGLPESRLLIVFSLGVFVMRSAGCIINDIADINLDVHVARTKNRPLTSGRLPVTHAWSLFIIFLLVALGLVLTLKRGTILLSFGALFLSVLYPWTKRWLSCPQIILSLAFSWSIPMAYYEILGKIPSSGVYLWAATICWIIAYDTIYAMVDKKDDLKIGIKSSAIAFGRYDVKIVTVLYCLFFILLMLFALTARVDLIFYGGLLAAIAYWRRYIFSKYKTKESSLCFTAFLYNNQIGIILFSALALSATSHITIS